MKIGKTRQKIIDKMRQGWQLCAWRNQPLGVATYALHIGHQAPIDVDKKDFDWLWINDMIVVVKRTPQRVIYELSEVPSDDV